MSYRHQNWKIEIEIGNPKAVGSALLLPIFLFAREYFFSWRIDRRCTSKTDNMKTARASVEWYKARELYLWVVAAVSHTIYQQLQRKGREWNTHRMRCRLSVGRTVGRCFFSWSPLTLYFESSQSIGSRPCRAALVDFEATLAEVPFLFFFFLVCSFYCYQDVDIVYGLDMAKM